MPLQTRAGTECVSHILQTLVESDANATIVSIDGIGAFDLVSRNAMLRGLKDMDTGDRVLPACDGSALPSLHIWEHEVGEVQDIPQGEGGDQGDPFMPLLFSLAMHPSLISTGNLFREGEKLFAFLDDVCLICKPERVLEVFRLIENALWIHSIAARRKSGTAVGPRGCEDLARAARALNPEDVGDLICSLRSLDTLCDEAVAAITTSAPQRERHERQSKSEQWRLPGKCSWEKCPELNSVSLVPR